MVVALGVPAGQETGVRVLPPHPVFWALLQLRSHLFGSEGFASFPP